MAKDYFQFRQFTIHQHRCAMKVGTDGTLLGAWAKSPLSAARILDIGTGTGLIALMMAQRFPDSFVVAIDIDPDAALQAQENVAVSPFADRIMVSQADLRDVISYITSTTASFSKSSVFSIPFDSIVCNPPYFVDSLISPEEQRTMARHALTLTYDQLTIAAYRLLRMEGFFSLVIPTDYRSEMEASARLAGFFPSRICGIKTTPNKQPKRYLMEFRKQTVNDIVKTEEVLEISPHRRSLWYQSLTQDFYIK